ncbi:hypothetical protein ACE193_17280 [Bernardetia sp. OM2101]|uniref:hypothetical protein n=1 Tax=Bernardetia sp. OM2101 TaxID=3344876 RepID=UPI0035CFD6F8
MNDLFLSIEYNEREFANIEEFKTSLDEHFNYQIRPKWIPAAAEGGEFWMTIFINSELKDFLVGAMAGGFLWDTIKAGGKKYLLKPLFEKLEKLNKDNSVFGGLKVRKLKFQFDNCEIIIGGLNSNFTSVISSVFNEISKKKPKFEDDNGLKVTKIELPIEYKPSIDKKDYSPYFINVFNDDYRIEVFKKMWKLTFETNFLILIYDFDKKKYFDAYPN